MHHKKNLEGYVFIQTDNKNRNFAKTAFLENALFWETRFFEGYIKDFFTAYTQDCMALTFETVCGNLIGWGGEAPLVPLKPFVET